MSRHIAKEIAAKLEIKLAAFLLKAHELGSKVKWLDVEDTRGKAPKVRVYVRKSIRLIGGSLVDCLDLGTIEVRRDLQRKGVLTAVLSMMERVNPWAAVFVENVMNPDVADAVHGLGYLTHQPETITEGHPLCLFKLKQ